VKHKEPSGSGHPAAGFHGRLGTNAERRVTALMPSSHASAQPLSEQILKQRSLPR